MQDGDGHADRVVSEAAAVEPRLMPTGGMAKALLVKKRGLVHRGVGSLRTKGEVATKGDTAIPCADVDDVRACGVGWGRESSFWQAEAGQLHLMFRCSLTRCLAHAGILVQRNKS